MKRYLDAGQIRAAAMLIIAVVICYGATVRGGFLYDDFPQIVENSDIRELGNIPSLFAKGVWDPSSWSVRFYRPLAFATWSVEYAMAGTDPFIYHLTNILLHFLCSLLVYSLLMRLTREELPALAGALVFAVHPVHSEAVGWVACRMDLMYTMFLLAGLILFMKRPYRRGLDWAAAVLFFLALMSKEAAAAFPGVLVVYMVLYDLPENGRPKHMALRLYPFAIMLGVYAAARVHAVGTVAAGSEASVFYGVPGFFVFLTMCKALTQYVRLTVFPFNLTIDYIFPPLNRLLNMQVLFALAALGAVLMFWRRLAAISKPVALGIGIFLVMLVPVSNIVILPNIMSERALYMPSVGFSMLVSVLVLHAGGPRIRISGRDIGWVYAPVLFVVLLYGLLTVEQNRYWYDPETFARNEMERYERRIAMFPGYMEYYSRYLETAVSQGGVQDGVEEVSSEAVRRFDDPGLFSLVAELCRLRVDAGHACGELPTGLPPDKYALAADAFMKHGMDDRSLKLIDMAVELDPDNPERYLEKGSILLGAGRKKEAVETLNRAVDIQPDNPGPYLDAGILLGAADEFGESALLLKKAAALAPENAEVHYYLAVAYLGLQRPDAAKKELVRALELDPGYDNAARLSQALGL